MYLRPNLQSVKFRDTDGSTGLAGVKNVITVNGVQRSEAVYSNAQGYFVVSGVKPSDKISITASKSGYLTNSTKIQNA